MIAERILDSSLYRRVYFASSRAWSAWRRFLLADPISDLLWLARPIVHIRRRGRDAVCGDTLHPDDLRRHDTMDGPEIGVGSNGRTCPRCYDKTQTALARFEREES